MERRLVDEGGSGDAFAGAPGCSIVDVEFDGDSLDPSGWFAKNMDGDKLVVLTVYHDTQHPEETGCHQAMHRVHWLGNDPTGASTSTATMRAWLAAIATSWT